MLHPSEFTLKQNFFIPQEWGKRANSSQYPHQLHISPLLSALPLPPCLQHCCSKENVRKIFEIIKGFGWANLEWVKLLEKNLKDHSGMQSCYINIFWMVPSYAQPWRHNCIKWNFIQKLWKCTKVGWLSALSVPFQTWSKKPRCWRRMWTVPRGSWPNLSKRFSFFSLFFCCYGFFHLSLSVLVSSTGFKAVSP